MINNYTGVSGSRIAYLAAAELKKRKKALIVVSSARVAERLKEDLCFFVPEASINIMPEEEDRILYEARNKDSLIQRIKGIQLLHEDAGDGKLLALIAPVSSLLKPTVSAKRFAASVNDIEVGQRIGSNELRKALVLSGYAPAPVTESAGEFAVRGGILDVFAPSYDNPLRIEFFDDEIDSIRFFDKDTQRSIENLRKITIGPAAEFVPSEAELQRICNAEGLDEAVKERLKEGTDIQLYSEYIEYFGVETTFLWEHMTDGIVMVADPTRVLDEIPERYNKEDFYKIYEKNTVIYTPFPENIKGVDKLDNIYNIRSRQIAALNGNMQIFAKEVAKYLKEGYSVTIVSSSSDRSKRIKDFLIDQDIFGNIEFAVGALSLGMVFDDLKLCYFTETDIFPQTRKKPLKRKKKSSNNISFSDLHEGDYVVHELHGIGRFEGIKPITTDGQTKDYLMIRYAGTDVLYIPTEQLDIIQKYIGSGGEAPSLSRLSGGGWKKTRERVKKAINEIAEDLVKLYAERERIGGYAFPEDSIWQREFEDKFPYTETEDQLRAIEEIKEDMQKPVPMDRLLCGDAGYGKTEVAARAIFKCLEDGRQAAILAPTTLLANQHFHNLKERFSDYPFEIQMLSRFRSPKQQEKTISDLKKGLVDLVIGTHRLLSKDVEFKNLGLLVIDEEQRFGVNHKEQIKMMRKDVDVLTLSATPIPRTLNMSLTGIKDISTIEEAPADRYPVQTFVTPEDDGAIKKIIERELERGGQVFVVNNAINGIDKIARRIQENVPDANVAVGHGQMSEEELENTMLDFVDGRYNVLVATTIIENGIDIPNANTIIVLNADRFGLSQLYQLKGRVGRSSRIAYAYLMYKPEKVLTEIARKRLVAIREFTEFGAGFKIAMKDLELRGAGNILGEAQSGHIEGIGYELYCKEIDRAVRALKGETVTEARADLSIEIIISAIIPPSYIEDETLKLQAYKKIASINGQDDADDVINELIDRYGDIPEETNNLIKIAEIRAHAEEIGVSTISEKSTRYEITFGESNKLNPYMLVLAKEELGDALTIASGIRPRLMLYTGNKLSLSSLLALMRLLRYNQEVKEIQKGEQ